MPSYALTMASSRAMNVSVVTGKRETMYATRSEPARPPVLLLLAVGVIGIAVGVLSGHRPLLALVAVAAALFLAGTLSDLAIGLFLFTILSFFDKVPALGGPTISVTKATGLLLALAWLATVVTREHDRRTLARDHPGLLYLLAVFVLWTAASAAWAESPSDALATAYRFGLNLFLFGIAYTAVRSMRVVESLFVAFVLGALISLSFGLVAGTPAEFGGDEGRVGGAHVNPNELASVLVPAVALAGALALNRSLNPLLRLGSFGACLLAVGGTLMTLSRSGLLALGVVLISAPFLAGRWRAPATAAAVVAIVAVVGYLAVLASPQDYGRVTELGTGTGRVDLWTVGFRIIEDRPLLGIGADNFRTTAIDYVVRPGVLREDEFIVNEPEEVHNIYLQVLVELGLVGFALFAAVVSIAVRCVLRAAAVLKAVGDSIGELLARALLVAILGNLVANFFASEIYSKQFWLLLALGPALLGLAAARARTAPRPSAGHP